MNLHSGTTVVPTKRRGTRVRLTGTAGAAALMVMAVAGCGGDAQEQAPTAGTEAAPASPSEAAATSEAPQADTPAEESPGVDDDAATTQPPSGTGNAQEEDEAAEEVVITISDFAYDLPDTIAPGTEVTIRNEDQVGHTVTSDEEGVFDVLVGGGQEETFTVPDEPGEYSFFCRPHPNMVDTLVIG